MVSEPDDFKAMAPLPDAARLALLKMFLPAPGQDIAQAAPPDADKLLSDPRMHELIEIINLAVQIHGGRTQEWFVQPEPELGFVHPLTLMRDPANGRKLVKQSLMNHLRGSYALDEKARVLPRSQYAAAPAPAGLPPPRKAKPKKKRRAA